MDALVLASCSTPRSVTFTPHDFSTLMLLCFLSSSHTFVIFDCVKLVGEAMSAIAANTNVPVTVKCRIGVDDHDSYDELCECLLFWLLASALVWTWY